MIVAPLGTGALMAWLSVTLAGAVPTTVVPNGMLSPLTDIPTATDPMPLNGSTLPAAAFALVWSATLSSGAYGVVRPAGIASEPTRRAACAALTGGGAGVMEAKL